MSRRSLAPQVLSARVIPVLRGLDAARVLEVTAVARDSGIAVAEITMRGPNATASIKAAVGQGAFLPAPGR